MNNLSEKAVQQIATPLDEKLKLGGINAAIANIDAILLIISLAQKCEEDKRTKEDEKKDVG